MSRSKPFRLHQQLHFKLDLSAAFILLFALTKALKADTVPRSFPGLFWKCARIGELTLSVGIH